MQQINPDFPNSMFISSIFLLSVEIFDIPTPTTDFTSGYR